MEQVKTRNMNSCPVFGLPQQINQNQLPTFSDVMKCYMLIKNELKPDSKSKEPTVGEISEKVATLVEAIWVKSSLPIVTHKRILQLIRSYHDKYRNLMKPYQERKESKSYIGKILKFQEDSQKFFDICSCKCESFECCKCEKYSKIPKQERDFLTDQRTDRKRIIGSLDTVTTMKEKKKEERKAKEMFRYQQTPGLENPSTSFNTIPAEEERKGRSSQDPDCSYTMLTEHELSTPSNAYAQEEPLSQAEYMPESSLKQMRLNLPSLALACDRTGVSDRSAAIIASAVLQDVGIIGPENKSFVVDRSKIRRERSKMLYQLQDTNKSEQLVGLYFDGRKDKTLSQEKRGLKYYKKVVSEGHYTLISEPGHIYLGHVTCDSGQAVNITTSILKCLNDKNIDLSLLSAVGCDGTVVNTGTKGGIIRLLELELKKPLQWFICQLHANELPLRHLLMHLDGETTGPRGFSGHIGKQLQCCEKLPVVDFEIIETTLPLVEDKADLSTDQKYLLDIMTAVVTGICSQDLANRYPGHMSHSRWLTTANRILRLYIAMETPTETLRTLSTFVVLVYGAMWFTIKTKPLFTTGTKHLLATIERSRYLSNDLKKVIDPVIQRNGYFGHAENILLCMLSDERKAIRELGYHRILKARSSQKRSRIRSFVVPAFNFEATDYIDLINWQELEITEPPLTSNLSTGQLQEIVESGSEPGEKIPRFPCHTQAVERCIKLVTEASEAVCGVESRDGFIRGRLLSRKNMPSFETKKEYAI